MNDDHTADEYEARGHRQETPLTIGQLNWLVKTILEQAIPRVWVEGEVSDVSRPSSGHIYFSLKDENSQIRAVIWRSNASRLPFQLKDGLSVVCCGAVDVYPPRGSYQLTIQQLHPTGVGPLQLAFQQLRQKLASEGLFDRENKSPLPQFPKRVGFITSPSGAAIHDFLEASKGRWADFSLTLIPSRVQGELAAGEIVRSIRLAERLQPGLDILIVGRGGGSIEDLWCFNEEAVVRAIHACPIPTVSAVGHEIDVTLSDLVADVRALTPTDAAQVVLPSQAELRQNLNHWQSRIDASLRTRLAAMERRLEMLTDRSLLASPHEIHLQRRQAVDEWETRGTAAIWSLLEAKKQAVGSMARATNALSPLNVLARGYSLTVDSVSGKPIARATSVAIEDEIESRLASGKIRSRVIEVIPEDHR